MKIISKRKDYYDWIVKMYGEDEKLILNRNVELDGSFALTKTPRSLKPINSWSDELKDPRINMIFYTELIFCGRRYVVENIKFHPNRNYVPQEDERRILSDEELLIRSENLRKNHHYYYLDFMSGVVQDTQEGVEHWKMVCKHFNSPIVSGEIYLREFKVKKEIPILTDFNFQLVMPPEEAFQRINNFISEVLYEVNIEELGNKDKIIKSGLDLKRSFRHRT